jgi:hypothetical protein
MRRGNLSHGENTMLWIVGVIVAFAAVVIRGMRVSSGAKAAPLGWMSEQWLAQHRSSHSL